MWQINFLCRSITTFWLRMWLCITLLAYTCRLCYTGCKEFTGHEHYSVQIREAVSGVLYWFGLGVEHEVWQMYKSFEIVNIPAVQKMDNPYSSNYVFVSNIICCCVQVEETGATYWKSYKRKLISDAYMFWNKLDSETKTFSLISTQNLYYYIFDSQLVIIFYMY